MSTTTRKSLLALSIFGLVALAGHAALANVSSVPGVAFKTDTGSQEQFFDVQSWAGGRNDGTGFLSLTGQVPFQSSNPLSITGNISSSSQFRAIVSNGVGNAAWIGPLVVGQQSGLAVNTLSLGTPPLFAGTALVVKAFLEPGGYIGLVWQ